MKLPEKFKERMIALIGEGEADDLFEAIQEREAVRAFRLNRIKTDADMFEGSAPAIDRRRVDHPTDAYLTCEEHPGSLPCHHSGAIYMQDISAMSTVTAVDIDEGMTVLDSCSAPGGKTTQLAAAVGERGIVIANEYDKKRCRILQSNIERMGAKNTVICNLDTAELKRLYPYMFDVVLCDAPCSGEGMFRKNEQAADEWSEENVLMCAERQREILSNVAKCVKPGGKLLYSTCTFSVEENEENVAWFLNENPDFKQAKVNKELIDKSSDGIMLEDRPYDMTLCRRIYPHRSLGEGQFIALFERKSEEDHGGMTGKREAHGKNKARIKDKNEREALAAAESFLRENISSWALDGFDRELRILGNIIFLSPCVELPHYNTVAAGVAVGEYRKGRILPHHQLFSAYGRDFKVKVMLSGDSEKAKKYLCGEEICIEGHCVSGSDRPDGFAAVLIDGCAVGGCKISGGIAKNHYPKGLRM